MKRYKEHRRVSADDIRSLCMNLRWYTSGTCEDYNRLLEKVEAPENRKLTTELIVEYAKDIIAHTACLTEENNLTAVMFHIANCSMTTFEECKE